MRHLIRACHRIGALDLSVPMANEILRSNRRRIVRTLEENQAKPRSTGLFWWLLVIALAALFASGSWFFSLYVFNFPERPHNYRLLTHPKVNKLPELLSYDNKMLSKFRFHTPKGHYEKFYTYVESEPGVLAELNATLLRDFLRNYETKSKGTTCLRGEFVIYKRRELTANDAFTSGYVIRAKAESFPNLAVELFLPCPSGSLSADRFKIGQKVIFGPGERAMFDSAVPINVRGEPDGHLAISFIPLNYQAKIPGRELPLKFSIPRHRQIFEEEKRTDPELQKKEKDPPFLNIDGSWAGFPPDGDAKSEDERQLAPARAIQVQD